MRKTLKFIGLDATPSIKNFIDEKFDSLDKILKNPMLSGLLDLYLEVRRVTRHHKKGNVFEVEAFIKVGKKNLRVEDVSEDVRSAIDTVKDKLHYAVERYKKQIIDEKRK